jgi:TonB-dependent receptor
MKYPRTMLAAGILAAFGLAGAAHAGDAVPAADAAAAQTPDGADAQTDTSGQSQQLDTIVVHGIRESLKRSLETKRDADAIVDAITAEDIGKFPNTNVAEAMVMIPGVTLDRRFGQGERVSIDGTDPSLNLSFLDGHPVAQAIWLYGEQPNRGFDYTLLAPEILGRLEVYKSPEARLTEGSLGGMVLMHTRLPLDLDANTLSGSIGYNYNDQASGGGKPNASIFYSWKNPESTWGFNVAAQHYEERVDRQGVEIFGYHPVSDYAAHSPGVAAQVANGELNPNALVPDEINAAWFQQTRKRNSAVANLQFKPNEAFDMTLSGLYIRENFGSYNQSVYNFLHQNAGTMGAVDHLVQSSDGLVTGGHSSGPNAAIIYDNQLRESVVTTKGLDLRGTYRGDGWRLGGQAGVSKSENPDIGQWLLEPTYFGGFGWDDRHGYKLDDPASGRDPSRWGGGWLGNHGVFSAHAKDTYGQLDFTKDLGGFFNQLLVGVRYSKHDEDYALNVYGGVTPGTLADVGTIGFTDILDQFDGFSPDHGHHIQVGPGNIRRWIGNSHIDWAHPDAGSYLNNTWALTQKNDAGYAQLNFGNDSVRGNVGVRFVHTETEGSGFNLPGSVAPVLPALPGWWQTKSSTANNWLPSFNVAWDAAPDVVLRVAGAEVIAWAPYNQMVNNTFLNDTVLTGSGGNADLKPFKSVNFNLSAEWYFAEQSVLAASLFHKNVINYIDTTPATERHYNSIRDTDPTQWGALVGSHGCTADGFCDYSVSRPHNAGSGSIKGVTLSYQQAFGESGFGLVANYTYADGSTSGGNPMPYQSKNSISVGPYYEQGPFSARLNYNWRSHYLAGGYVAGAPPAVVGAYADLSGSVGWHFNEHFALTFDAMNLLNEKYRQYAVDNKNQLFGEYTTGRRYMATLRMNF